MAHIWPHGLFFTNKGERVIWSSWCSSKSTNLKQIQNLVKNSLASCTSDPSLQGFLAYRIAGFLEEFQGWQRRSSGKFTIFICFFYASVDIGRF